MKQRVAFGRQLTEPSFSAPEDLSFEVNHWQHLLQHLFSNNCIKRHNRGCNGPLKQIVITKIRTEKTKIKFYSFGPFPGSITFAGRKNDQAEFVSQVQALIVLILVLVLGGCVKRIPKHFFSLSTWEEFFWSVDLEKNVSHFAVLQHRKKTVVFRVWLKPPIFTVWPDMCEISPLQLMSAVFGANCKRFI